MKIDKLTPDQAILKELGQRLARLRKQQALSQTRLAEEAGVGVATVRRIEGGQDSQMETWIKLCKALGMVSAIDQFMPETLTSPMQQVLSGSKRKKVNAPTDTKEASAEYIKWGDETP